MFILKGVLRAKSQEQVLIYLLLRERGYPKEISDFFGSAFSSIYAQMAKMEEDGVLVGWPIGKARQFELNPRYAFKKELATLIERAIEAYPEEQIHALKMNRRRPRFRDKPVNYIEE